MTATKKRTDEHRRAEIAPENYEWMDSYDAHPPIFWGYPENCSPEQAKLIHDSYMEALEKHKERLRPIRESGTSVYNDPYRCDHCGARIRYGNIYHHAPTGDVITTGDICAEETMNVPDRARLVQKRLREAAAASRMREAENKAARERREVAEREFPEAVALLETYDGENSFIADVAYRFKQKGYLSEKQANSLLAAYARDLQREELKRKEREMMERGEIEPCPSGKGVVVTGTVLSNYAKETDYGMRYVMTIRDDRGFKVWGSEPSTIKAQDGEMFRGELVGQRIRLTANLERSDRDEGFGFFKRPRKAEVPPA